MVPPGRHETFVGITQGNTFVQQVTHVAMTAKQLRLTCKVSQRGNKLYGVN